MWRFRAMVLLAVFAGCASQEELALQAKSSKDRAARQRAVKGLHDPELLLDVAMTAEDRIVRLEATRKLEGPHLRAVRTSPSAPVLRLIDDHLSDVTVDGQPFKSADARLLPGRRVVSAAYRSRGGILKWTGQVSSSRFEAAPGDMCVAWAVVQRGSSGTLGIWFIKSSCGPADSFPTLWRELPRDGRLGLLKVPELTDLRWLRNVGRIEDPALLVELAQNDKSSSVRLTALQRLGERQGSGAAALTPKLQATLADLAKSDESWRVRKTAVGLLTDLEVLARVAETDENSFVRRAGAERLEELKGQPKATANQGTVGTSV